MCLMRPSFRPTLLALLLAALATTISPAHAATECKDVPGIGPEIAKFLDEVKAMQAAGQGDLPLMHALFGITNIDAKDQQDIARREPIKVVKNAATGGNYSNRGPKKILVDGLFAGETTFFRIPKFFAGRYTLTVHGDALDGVTLNYDPAHSVELGAEVMGLRFFKPIHHTVITRDGLAFFLDTNAGPDPDRCYRAVAG
jgi:hypothetical protein